MCQNNVCQTIPPDCRLDVEATEDGCACAHNKKICVKGETCMNKTHANGCYNVCPSDALYNATATKSRSSHCVCNLTFCPISFACDSESGRCINKCPPILDYFQINGVVTLNHKCFCNYSSTSCLSGEICGIEGCLEYCPDDSPANSTCYCNRNTTCTTGQVCQDETCYNACSDMEENTLDCYCNSSSSICEVGSLCNMSTSTCLTNCPETTFYFENTINLDGPCFCKSANADCAIDEICGAQGCLEDCEDAENSTCYCTATITCSPFQKCVDDECYEPCPDILTPATIDCYCKHSGTVCSPGQVCNNDTDTCSDPLQQCPEYSEVSNNTCLCKDRLCNSGNLCDESGVCREPETCTLPTKVDIVIDGSASPTLQEGISLTVKCQSCHYFLDDPDSATQEISCQKDGNWNKTVECKKIECSSLDYELSTVEKTETDSNCNNSFELSCMNNLEYFPFDNNVRSVSFNCSPR